MRSITVTILFVCIAEELAANHSGDAQDSMDKATNKLADKSVNNLLARTLEASSAHHAALDNTLLGKSSHLAISPSSQASSSPSLFAIKSPTVNRGGSHAAVGKQLIFADGRNGRHQSLRWRESLPMPGRRVLACRAEKDDPDEIMSDDPMLIALEAEAAELNRGNWNKEVGLQQLLSPSKVVNLERDLIKLRAELNATSDAAVRLELQENIDKKEDKKQEAMRGVMADWLKAVFVGQSALSVVICGLLAYDALPGFPNLDFVVRVLGFWGIWLFTIPSLRARKAGGTWGLSDEEKRALDVSFLLAPLTNVAAPTITKNPPDIFWANVAVITACYGFSFLAGPAGEGKADLPTPIKWALTALDFGSGQERGMNREKWEAMQEAKEQKQKEKEKAGS